MDITKIPTNVLDDLRKRGHSDKDIAELTPEDAFSEYCMWNGLIGYGSTLIRALDGLRAAKSELSEDQRHTVEAAFALTMICHGAARDAGWWNDADPNTSMANPLHFASKLCLIHSEISEAMEGDRKRLNDDKLNHRPMREVELADAVIRIFDLAGGYGMDLAGAIAEKLAYNAQRADHRPENRAADGGKAY